MKPDFFLPARESIEARLRGDEWEPIRREIAREIENDTKAQLLANPWQHLKVSLLLAWRGVFAEHGLGHVLW